MAQRRKKSSIERDILLPKLYISNYSYRPLRASPSKTPYKTTRPLLANFFITVIIIAILVFFSSLLREEAVKKTMWDFEIEMELGDDHYPYPKILLNDDYIRMLLKEKVADFHFDESEIEAGFEEFSYAPEQEIHYPEGPELFPNGAAIIQQAAPIIAIVIDDMGFEGYKTEGIIDLPPPLDLSFLPYVKSLESKVAHAFEKGHEIMIHIPMEPTNAKYDAGPGHLKTSMPSKEIKEKSKNIFKNFKYFAGVNNHMGSKFTEQEKPMRIFLEELKKQGGFFLDSKTTSKSVGEKLAKELQIPHISRDIFLDNVPKKKEIIIQLQKLEVIAARRGYAVGIGHPYKGTIEALKEWLPLAKQNGFNIVPLSQMLEHLDMNRKP